MLRIVCWRKVFALTSWDRKGQTLTLLFQHSNTHLNILIQVSYWCFGIYVADGWKFSTSNSSLFLLGISWRAIPRHGCVNNCRSGGGDGGFQMLSGVFALVGLCNNTTAAVGCTDSSSLPPCQWAMSGLRPRGERRVQRPTDRPCTKRAPRPVADWCCVHDLVSMPSGVRKLVIVTHRAI